MESMNLRCISFLFIIFKGICDPHADFEIYMLLFISLFVYFFNEIDESTMCLDAKSKQKSASLLFIIFNGIGDPPVQKRLKHSPPPEGWRPTKEDDGVVFAGEFA